MLSCRPPLANFTSYCESLTVQLMLAWKIQFPRPPLRWTVPDGPPFYLLSGQMHRDNSSPAQSGPSLIRGPQTQGPSGPPPPCGAAAGSCTCNGSCIPHCSPLWRASWTRWCGSGRTGMKRWEKRGCSLFVCVRLYRFLFFGADQKVGKIKASQLGFSCMCESTWWCFNVSRRPGSHFSISCLATLSSFHFSSYPFAALL